MERRPNACYGLIKKDDKRSRDKNSSTSLHNTLSTCLRFVQLQSNFYQSLTGYIVDVAETLTILSKKAAWNFLLSLLLLVPRTYLPAAAVYLSFLSTLAFSS